MRRHHRLALLVTASLLFVACDAGDGRDLEPPSVPYVAPTDPPTTSTP